jgi:hypothetical protein
MRSASAFSTATLSTCDSSTATEDSFTIDSSSDLTFLALTVLV